MSSRTNITYLNRAVDIDRMIELQRLPVQTPQRGDGQVSRAQVDAARPREQFLEVGLHDGGPPARARARLPQQLEQVVVAQEV